MLLIEPLAYVSLLYLFHEAGGEGVCSDREASLRVIMTGQDLNLNLNLSSPVDWAGKSEFRWKFNKFNIVRYAKKGPVNIVGDYPERVEFSEETYHLRLKEVQREDSGLYTATILGDTDDCLDKYNVEVQDPVSRPTLTVVSVSNQSSSCVLAVTCRTPDSLRNVSTSVICHSKNCSLLGGELWTDTSSDGSRSLRVSLIRDTVICNHSNKVSEETVERKTTLQLCSANNPSNAAAMIGVPVGTALTALLVALTIGLYMKCRRHKVSQENTVYEVPQRTTSDQDRSQTTSDHGTTSTYAFVEFPNRSNSSTTLPNPGPPESLYAQVNTAAKTDPTHVKTLL